MKKVIGLVLITLVVIGMAVICTINGAAIGEKCGDAINWIVEKFFRKEEKSN